MNDKSPMFNAQCQNIQMKIGHHILSYWKLKDGCFPEETGEISFQKYYKNAENNGKGKI